MKVYDQNYDFCPNCGCTEYTEKVAARTAAPAPKPQKKADKKPLVIMLAVFLTVALVALVALIVSSIPGKDKAKDETESTVDFTQQEILTTDGTIDNHTIDFPEYEEYVPEITYTTEPESETTKKVGAQKMRELLDVSDCDYADAEQALKKIKFSVKKEIIKNTDPAKTGKVKEAKGLKFGENYPEGTKVTLLVYGEAVPTTVSAANAKWKQAYIDIVKASDGPAVRFELGYVDDDDIPELFVSGAETHVASAKVYTYSGGKAVELCDTGSYGSAQYIEREGYIGGYYMGMGALATKVYRLENAKATEVYNTMDQSYVDEVSLGDKKKEYKINGEAVAQKDLVNYYNIYFGRDLWNDNGQMSSPKIKIAPDILATDANLKAYITDFKG